MKLLVQQSNHIVKLAYCHKKALFISQAPLLLKSSFLPHEGLGKSESS